MRGVFKRIKYIWVFLVAALLFSACAPMSDIGEFSSGYVTVSIVDNPYFSADNNIFRVKRGEDVQFRLVFAEGASFRSCSYGDYSVQESGEDVLLVLHEVNYPQRVTVEAGFNEATIYYHLNGGSFIDGSAGDSYFKSYEMTNHTRVNTEIGTDIIVREGYLLTGWNTDYDASGEHIGLGSRVTVNGDGILNLYAEWEESLPEELFVYEISGGEIALTGYTGGLSAEKFVVPRTVGGLPVTSIKKGFVSGVNGRELILPDTLYEVEGLAFRNCSFEEITFFDGIQKVGDSSFWGFSFNIWHINAVLPPCYQAISEHVQFADNIDHLILSMDENRLLFFGGCSMSYGLDSAMIDERYGEKYRVWNLGVIGGIDAGFQFEIITQYLKEGDVLVHAPEVGSIYQLMADRTIDSRFFMMVEGNYDLLSHVDMSRLDNVFSIFEGYNGNRSVLPDGNYADGTGLYNEYGDMVKPRPYTGEVRGEADDEYTYDMDAANDVSAAALCDVYDRMTERGCTVYFSFSPINSDGLSKNTLLSYVWEKFEAFYRSALSARGYAVISCAADYLYGGDYFYDTDYHLNEAGVVLRTQQLLNDLSVIL